jgi:hypothetical protein
MGYLVYAGSSDPSSVNGVRTALRPRVSSLKARDVDAFTRSLLILP